MQVTQYPNGFSSAFGEVIFTLAATPEELIELDILGADATTVIAKKRLKGSAQYAVNVAGYARQQLDVVPLRPYTSALIVPRSRLIRVTLRAGGVEESTLVTGGIEPFSVYHKLTKAPEPFRISPTQHAELSIRMDGGIPITAEAQLVGPKRSTTLQIGSQIESGLITTLCINMPDLEYKLGNAGKGPLSDYRTMRVVWRYETDQLFACTYEIVPDREDQVRICWWNRYGQIDYYTMKRATQSSLRTSKERVYTQEGYKTIGSTGQRGITLVSEYEPRAVMEWIEEMIASPRVWIERQQRLIPVEILTDRTVTSDEGLTRLQIEVVEAVKTNFLAM